MNRLKQFIKASGMTQEAWATELGLSRVYVSRVANNEETPGDAFMWKFYVKYGPDVTQEVFDFEAQQ